MTSNMGSQLIRDNFSHMTADNREQVIDTTREAVLNMLKQTIRPEFLNRIDETIMFTPLSENEIQEIVEMQIASVRGMLAKNGVQLQLTPDALAFLSHEGYDPEFGARPVKRVIQRQLLNALSKQLLSGTVDNTRPIVVDVHDGSLTFTN